MKALLPLLLLLSECVWSGCSAAKTAKNDKVRLFNSRNAVDGQFPYVALHVQVIRVPRSICTAGLITDRWVLTAAHCLIRSVGPENELFVAGKADMSSYMAFRTKNSTGKDDVNEEDFGVQERRAAATFVHPRYSPSGSHDVGLARMNRPFVLNEYVRTMPINQEPVRKTTTCTAVGYGTTESGRLYHLQFIKELPIKPANQCLFQRFRDVLCVGKRTQGLCQGDSGGPLVCGGKISGVASHGLNVRCGVGVIEQYYADAYKNLKWIKGVMARNSSSSKMSRDRYAAEWQFQGANWKM